MADFTKVKNLKACYPRAMSYFQNSEFKCFEKEVIASAFVNLSIENGDWLKDKISFENMMETIGNFCPAAYVMFEDFIYALRDLVQKDYFSCSLDGKVVNFQATEKLCDFCERNVPTKSDLDSDGKKI